MKTSRNVFSRVLGVGALFSGAALVTHIVAGFSLPLALMLTATILVLAVRLAWRRASPKERMRLVRLIKVGLLSGLLATVAYDASKFALSQWDTSPYNPFEAIRLFGMALVGSSVPESMVYTSGTAFHVLNGISFGVGYCFLFGHHGVIAGIAWSFFLELFQLTLYPGWLDIRFYREFVQISALSHLVYGAVLGYSCQYGLRRGL